MTKRVSNARRRLYVALPLGAFALVMASASCQVAHPPPADGISSNPAASLCGTPNDGCPCAQAGQVVDCGRVEHTAGDYVSCAMGHRTCQADGAWGTCIGDGDITTKGLVAVQGSIAVTPISLTPLNLGAPVVCPAGDAAGSNPCDPYCNQFGDTPVGIDAGSPFGVTPDGGLTVLQAGGDAGAPANWVAPAGGNTACTGLGANVHSNPCNASPLTSCQQDFHCDAITNTCLWNGGPGYIDPSAPGVDLTIGAACTNGAQEIPLCNRGNAPVLTGTSIGVNFFSPPSIPNGCVSTPPADCTVALTSDLVPGSCISMPCTIPADQYAVVNIGQRDVPEPGGRCANNSAYVQTVGAAGCAACTSCNTVLKGKVYDPSGASPAAGANNTPLAGITVFEPSAPLTTFSAGLACDSCASLSTPAQSQTTTAADGSFTLNNVSPGTVPIVVQSGRWRRVVTVSAPQCVTTTLPAGTLRMPQSRTDGLGGVADIPKTALITGNLEHSLACLLRKMGVASSEMQRRVAPTDLERFQIYTDNGMTMSPAAPSPTTLYGTPAQLDEYTAMILDCPGTAGVEYSASAAMKTAVAAWGNAGGHYFGDHWAAYGLVQNSTTPAWIATANWTAPQNSGFTMKGVIDLGTPPQQLFHDWMNAIGGSVDYGVGTLRVDEPRVQVLSVNPTGVEWIRGSSVNPTTWSGPGNFTASYSFDTPVGGNCGTANGTGRVFFNGMHAAQTRAASPYVFPGNCDLSFALTPEELALEYQIFQLTACQLGGSPPPPPPPPPPNLPVVTFTRDFNASCPPGNAVKWGPFYWEAAIPAGTNIDFRGATAATQAALPASPPAGAPTTAHVGKALVDSPAPTWDCQGCPGAPTSVDGELKTDTGAGSQAWLRIYMTFDPLGAVSPTLNSWRQIYDCIPDE